MDGEEEGEEHADDSARPRPRSDAQRAHAARIAAVTAENLARRKAERADPYAAVRVDYLASLFCSPRFSRLDAASRFHTRRFHTQCDYLERVERTGTDGVDGGDDDGVRGDEPFYDEDSYDTAWDQMVEDTNDDPEMNHLLFNLLTPFQLDERARA